MLMRPEKSRADREIEALRRYSDQANGMASRGLLAELALPTELVDRFEYLGGAADARRERMRDRLAHIDDPKPASSSPAPRAKKAQPAAPPRQHRGAQALSSRASHDEVMILVNRELNKRKSSRFTALYRDLASRGGLY